MTMRAVTIWGALCALAAAAGPLGCGSSDSTMPAPAAVAPLAPGASGTAGAGPASSPDPVPAPGSLATEALSRALIAAVEQGDAPGVVGLVVDRNGVVFEGSAGQLNVAAGMAMPADAIFNIASMTKPVTSVAAMMLFEQGELGLDDPVSMYLPGFDALEVLTSFDAATGAFEAEPATSVMTVRHLLSHTSGIGYAFANSTVAALQQTIPGPEWGLPLLNEPGAEWHYSASTRVLGLIVEAVSGENLEELFQARIFQPLGMNDTSFAVPREKQARIPTLHTRGADGTLQEAPQNGIPATPAPPFGGDGGLYSTAHDYGQFMRMFLNGGSLGEARILSENTVALMGENQIGAIFVEQQEAAIPALTKPFPLGAGVDKFGLGFQITMSSEGAARSVGSMAWAGLFNTEFWIDPAQGVAATLLMQVLPFYDDGALRALQGFEAAVYRNLAPAATAGN